MLASGSIYKYWHGLRESAFAARPPLRGTRNTLNYLRDTYLENCKHSNGIHRHDERGEEEGLQQGGRELVGVDAGQPAGVECRADGDHVEDGSDDGHEEDGADVVEEEAVGHEVAGLEDDGRQQDEEEGVGLQHRHHLPARQLHEDAEDDAGGDQETGLRKGK